MNDLAVKNAKIVTEIFESYGISTLTYAVDGTQCGEIVLPYVPDGVISEFSVSCDGNVFAKARAINVRELNATPFKNAISLSRRIDGLIVVKFLDVPPCREIEFSVCVCFKLSRRANHSSISFLGVNRPEVFAPFELFIKINDDVEKVSSPTHKIFEGRSESITEVKAEGNLYNESFILDIFYKKNQPNGVIISRHPLRDNIALCRFTPKIEGFLGKTQDFEIYVFPNTAALLSVLLRSLGEENRFRVFLDDKCVWDFAFATNENIDSCLENVLNPAFCDFEVADNSKKIVIAKGNSLPSVKLPKADLIILYDGFDKLSKWRELGKCLCVSREDMQSLIPLEVLNLFGASVSPAYLEPLGGLGVSLVPKILDEVRQDEVSYCFARHNVIPPQKIRISSGGWAEDVRLDTLSTQPNLIPVDIMYAVEMAKEIEKEKSNLPYEDRFLAREQVNDICQSYEIAFSDIALVCFSGDIPLGIVDIENPHSENYQKFFNEDTISSAPEILSLILNSQTSDGVIAKDLFQDEYMLVLSTAVCLIALYLYTKDNYSLFAKRSLEFLKGKNGYWAETAIKLWNGEEIDFDILLTRADMKIMYERLDELAVLLIQNLRRK